MLLSGLIQYQVKTIKIKGYYADLGKAYPVVDDGQVYRIAELHVIPKSKVNKIEKTKDTITITYNNGEVIELGIV